MAAVMTAGMTPPLATAVRGKVFTPAERRAGQANWILGASFITEGVITFAAVDPIRVIPSMMVGSAITASLSLAFGATLPAPHGGVFVVGLIGNWPLYLLAIAIGTLVGTVLVIVAKGLGRNDTSKEPAAASA